MLILVLHFMSSNPMLSCCFEGVSSQAEPNVTQETGFFFFMCFSQFGNIPVFCGLLSDFETHYRSSEISLHDISRLKPGWLRTAFFRFSCVLRPSVDDDSCFVRLPLHSNRNQKQQREQRGDKAFSDCIQNENKRSSAEKNSCLFFRLGKMVWKIV